MEALSNATPLDLEVEHDDKVNHEALLRIRNNPSYSPLSAIIPESVALQVEPWLERYGRFHPETRVAIYNFVRFNLVEGNWAKSKQSAAIELGIDVRALDYYKKAWPKMWLLINTLVRQEAEEKVGRVIASMSDAAIMGDSRDKRLYLEFFGHIRKEVVTGDGKTIIFVNDNLNRPPALRPVIDVEKIEE